MEDDPLEEVAEAHVVIFGERFEDFQDPLFDPDPRLDSLDDTE